MKAFAESAIKASKFYGPALCYSGTCAAEMPTAETPSRPTAGVSPTGRIRPGCNTAGLTWQRRPPDRLIDHHDTGYSTAAAAFMLLLFLSVCVLQLLLLLLHVAAA